MYKLTIVAGPNRGTSYAVQDGENSIGRQVGNAVVLQSSKVSKRHCVLVVDNTGVTLKDAGSSNGTFVNGVLTKQKQVKAGDRISVGEYVFELTQPPARAPRPAPAVALGGNVVQFPGMPGAGGLPAVGGLPGAMPGAPAMPGSAGASAVPAGPVAPKDIKGRILFAFDNFVMPFFYGLNLKNEWRVICAGMFAAFMLGNLVITVYPMLQTNREKVVGQIAARAKLIAQQIAERNAPYLAQKAETKTDVGSFETADGVRLAVLTDLDSRVLAPASKLNSYLTTGPEARFAIRMRDLFKAGRETGLWAEVEEGTVVAVEPVRVLSNIAGRNVTVGMAVVSLDSSLATPDMGEIGMVYSETLILTGLLGLLILVILYKLTLKPFQVLNEDMDKALKGDIPQVTHEFKLEELNPLWEIINSALQRVPKGGGGGGGGDSLGGSPGGGGEEYVGPLKMIGNAAKFGMIVLDGGRKVSFMNPMFEEISGIRGDQAIGQEMSAVARDQSMGAFVGDLCDRAPVGGEGVSEDYDFSGIGYKVHCGAFGPGPGSARCFVMIVVRNEG